MTLAHRLRAAAGNSSSDIVQTGLNSWFDVGDSNCYTHPASWQTGYDPTFMADLSGNNNDARILFYRGGTSMQWGCNFDSSAGGHLVFNTALTYSGQTSQFPTIYRNTDIFDNLGNGDFSLEFWFAVNNNSGYASNIFTDKNSGIDWVRSKQSGGAARMNGWFGQSMTEYNGPLFSWGQNPWKHYVMSVTGRGTNSIKFYWNGVHTDSFTPSNSNYWNYVSGATHNTNGVSNGTFAGSGNQTAAWGPWTGVTMFGSYGANQRYQGKFAIFRMYRNYALTQADVTKHWTFERTRFGV